MLIKETASSIQLNSKVQKGFMTIIFNEAEKLSKEAQASLRRTMEKYVMKCRLILICENLGNLIPALLSRCFLIRVRCPSTLEVRKCLEKTAQKENFSIDNGDLNRLVEEGSLNIRRSLMGLQNVAMKKKSSGNLKFVDWRDSVKSAVGEIKKSQTPNTLKNVRCYDLLVNCIPGGMIIREFLQQLLKEFSSDYLPKLIKYAAFYEKELQNGSKDILFIEAFLAQVMVLFAEQNANIRMDPQEVIENLN